MDYCEAQNGYVCQRPAVAAAAPDATGMTQIIFQKGYLNISINK